MDDTADTKRRKAALRRKLELVRVLRDQLSLKTTLARAQAAGDWKQLEERFQLAEEEIARLEHQHAKDPLDSGEPAAHRLLDELEEHYQYLREHVDPERSR